MRGQEQIRILLAVSESSIRGYPYPSISSKEAFNWTIEKIVGCNPSAFKLFLLHVQPGDYHRNREEREKNRLRALQLLQHFLIQCGNIMVRCEGLNKQGNPKEVICRVVKQMKPDLLVMGSSRPRFGLGAYFWRFFVAADVSEYCLKHAECPVVIIKGEADDEDHHEELPTDHCD